jgi:hypothetical protein
MRAVVLRISSTYLAAYVAVIDATVWLAALPFELYCKSLLATGRPSSILLVLILLVNLLILGLMTSSVVATGELMRRGVTRMGRWPQLQLRRPAPAYARVRPRRSGY